MKKTRPEPIQGSQLQHARENELGSLLGIHQAEVHPCGEDPHFPDSIVFHMARGKEKKIRIEFEFRSRNFKSHPARRRPE